MADSNTFRSPDKLSMGVRVAQVSLPIVHEFSRDDASFSCRAGDQGGGKTGRHGSFFGIRNQGSPHGRVGASGHRQNLCLLMIERYRIESTKSPSWVCRQRNVLTGSQGVSVQACSIEMGKRAWKWKGLMPDSQIERRIKHSRNVHRKIADGVGSVLEVREYSLFPTKSSILRQKRRQDRICDLLSQGQHPHLSRYDREGPCPVRTKVIRLVHRIWVRVGIEKPKSSLQSPTTVRRLRVRQTQGRVNRSKEYVVRDVIDALAPAWSTAATRRPSEKGERKEDTAPSSRT
ncbi:UNVERIFIED_CONTAM: hypothetical protein PYX00_001290 [Menopon gallinae]|uniref:Uncharacterized protein n=1 Tax=Menopon gallinae TaxID=328185 RepID=A0AAW2ID00_9NEOP